MNRRWIAVTVIAVAIIAVANIIILLVLVPRWSKAANNSPSSSPATVVQTSAPVSPAAAAPAPAARGQAAMGTTEPARGAVATSQPAPGAKRHPTPLPVQAGLHLDRQVLTASGSLRVRYLRDRAQGLREITLQDAHNPANEMVLTQYKRNAWVVVSPDDDWVLLEKREKGEESDVQLFHRVSASPLKYEVPQELQAHGNDLRDQIWQSYLNETQQDPNIDPRRVTIDATAWDSASQKVTLSVSPLPTKDNRQVPMAWTCLYNVTTKQVEPVAEDVAEASAPNEQPTTSEAGQNSPSEPQENQEETAQEDSSQAAPAEGSEELDGERFPATREQEITVENANELELSDLRYAIFEMYARHNAEIHDAKMKKEFEKMPWYQPKPGFSFDAAEAEFSSIEKHNLDVLRRVRDAKTARAAAAAHRPERKALKGEPVQEESDGQRILRGVIQGVSDALGNGGNP